MEWNLEGWKKKSKMLDLIKEQNADVLCFVEYNIAKRGKRDTPSVTLRIKNMGYPYSHFAETENNEQTGKTGVIIFSKYPIIDSGTYRYPGNTFAESLIYVDIKLSQEVYRVFTTHLESVRFEGTDYSSIDKLKRAGDPGYQDSRSIASKLKRAYHYRYDQAHVIQQKINESPHPVIITGDFNDVPNSNTYFTIRGNLQDAFLKKGSFIGRTFRFISPTLRIDYILTDKKFRVDQFRINHVPYSDHYPIVADLQY